MKFLRYFPDGPSAQLARSILAANGIDAFVGDPPDTFSIKGVRLLVPEEHMAAAREILDTEKVNLALPDDWEPPSEEESDPDEGSPAAGA